jgi:hypothetical protein
MKKAVFLLSFGLLPFWVASIFVWRGSIGAPADYWNVAPWLIVISLPACAITLGIAIVTVIVYGRTAGEPRDKFRAAAKRFGVLASICALLAGLWYLTLMKRQEHNEDLRERAIALVRSHPAVVQEFGPEFTAGIASMTAGSDERPKRFEVRVNSDAKRRYAIVDVSGNELRFACLTSIDPGHRSSGKHPCEQ